MMSTPAPDVPAATALPPWPDYLDDAPWPSPYRAYDDGCEQAEPRLPRRLIVSLAPIVAQWFLEDDQTLPRRYGTLSAVFQQGVRTNDLSADYAEVLRARLSDVPVPPNTAPPEFFDVINQHDIANLHRAVWLTLNRAIVCMLNINLHGDWGDPPAGGSSQGREGYAGGRNFHTIPNNYGSFAISTLDILPPDVGIGEAAPGATGDEVGGEPLSTDDIRRIARALGRGLIVPGDGEYPSNGDRYLAVVKSYYRDGLNHTSVPTSKSLSYTDVIRSIVGKEAVPEKLTDDDVANIHRGAWLFVAHRFCFLVGKLAFGEFVDVDPNHPRSVPIRMRNEKGEFDERTLQVPNAKGVFSVNLRNIDPDEEPAPILST